MVDAAPLVYLIEGAQGSPRRLAVERFLDEERAAGTTIVASAIVWTELLELPLRSGDAALADRYRAFLSDSSMIRIECVEVAIAEEAAALRARRGLALADSIHIATARVLGAASVLTNDEAWRGIPECPPVFLVDELAFDAE